MYDPQTGNLFWKPRDVKWFSDSTRWSADQICKSWNTRYANKPAFTSRDSDGYPQGHILTKSLRAHRLIWLLVHGVWPDNIDHINKDRSDNRLENLRSVTHKENMQNKGPYKRRMCNE